MIGYLYIHCLLSLCMWKQISLCAHNSNLLCICGILFQFGNYVRCISTDKMSEHTEEKPAAYIRRRAFNKVHVKSWLIYLEKDGFVRCSFKNCNFMAFNVEEMRNHYGYCKGVSYQ